MKKTILLLSLLLSLSAVVSCEKENSPRKNLSGTTWMLKGGDGEVQNVNLSFFEDEAILFFDQKGGLDMTFLLSYDYDDLRGTVRFMQGFFSLGSVTGPVSFEEENPQQVFAYDDKKGIIMLNIGGESCELVESESFTPAELPEIHDQNDGGIDFTVDNLKGTWKGAIMNGIFNIATVELTIGEIESDKNSCKFSINLNGKMVNTSVAGECPLKDGQINYTVDKNNIVITFNNLTSTTANAIVQFNIFTYSVDLTKQTEQAN